VAIALKYENPGLRVSAADISAAALEVARENARKLLAERPGTPLVFIQSDLFENIPGRFDCITANPPYIPTEIIDTLPREVRGEPRLALDGGSGGLDIIRRLIPEAALHLNPGGALFIEADPRQMAAITGILENCGYRSITIWKDLPGRDRVIGGLWK
jgi:release factor glutamine methyltransferase